MNEYFKAIEKVEYRRGRAAQGVWFKRSLHLPTGLLSQPGDSSTDKKD